MSAGHEDFSPSQNSPSSRPNPAAYVAQSPWQSIDPSWRRWNTCRTATDIYNMRPWNAMLLCFDKDLFFYSISIAICDSCWSIEAIAISRCRKVTYNLCTVAWVTGIYHFLAQLTLEWDGGLKQDGGHLKNSFLRIFWTAWLIFISLHRNDPRNAS